MTSQLIHQAEGDAGHRTIGGFELPGQIPVKPKRYQPNEKAQRGRPDCCSQRIRRNRKTCGLLTTATAKRIHDAPYGAEQSNPRSNAGIRSENIQSLIDVCVDKGARTLTSTIDGLNYFRIAHALIFDTLRNKMEAQPVKLAPALDQFPNAREMMIVVFGDEIQMIHQPHRGPQARVRESSGE